MDKSDFEFSEDLRCKVEDAVVSRIADAMQNDRECAEEQIRYGMPNIEDMDDLELMDHYMDWHGTYSLEENPDDNLLRRMFTEVEAFEFEKEVLNVEETIQRQEDSTDSISEEEIG